MSKARIITATNVNHALNDALWHLKTKGVISDSRNGRVVRAPGPVITEYLHPRERLVSPAWRDANHVFHLAETIWMLSGANRVEWLLQFNSSFSQFAESDGTQHGAYGHRWFRHFDMNQIHLALEELRKPNNRRVVVQMWDARTDFAANYKDVPCNTHIYFEVQDGELNMTVCCRSNDIMWGAYGANAVHFSMLQELMATTLGVRVGTYYQLSNNFHMYLDFGPGKLVDLHALPTHAEDDYELYTNAKPVPLLQGKETIGDFIADCHDVVRGHDSVVKTAFMRRTAVPILKTYILRKKAQPFSFEHIEESDWKHSFQGWVNRRTERD